MSNRIRVGLVRDKQNKIVFDSISLDRNCGQGCIILTLGWIFVTMLRNGCVSESL
jgi:hypothetical protein